MKYLVITNNIVENIVVSEPDFAEAQGWIPYPTEVRTDGSKVESGWSYNEGVFAPPPRNIPLEWVNVRYIRNQLLTMSDPYVLPDRFAAMTSEKQTEWAAYRQSLRDIPSSFDDPEDIVWPTKPE